MIQLNKGKYRVNSEFYFFVGIFWKVCLYFTIYIVQLFLYGTWHGRFLFQPHKLANGTKQKINMHLI